MRNRVLHLKPRTKGFNSFTPAEYLDEMLGEFMNARTKGGAKQEFEQKKQVVNESTMTLNYSCIYMLTMKEKEIHKISRG